MEKNYDKFGRTKVFPAYETFLWHDSTAVHLSKLKRIIIKFVATYLPIGLSHYPLYYYIFIRFIFFTQKG